MSILGSIRKNSWLLLVAIGMALLAFVFSPDTFNKFKMGDANLVGEINGQKVSLHEFNDAINHIHLKYQGRLPDRNIQTEAWDNIVQQTLFEQQSEELGIETTADNKQYWDTVEKLLGQRADTFKQNGVFNVSLFQSQENLARQQGDSQAISFFELIKSEAKRAITQANYIGMIQQGIFLTDKELEFEYDNTYSTANIEYVYVPYSSFPGANEIKISDEEINAYVKKHSKKFDREETRDLQYALLDVKASTKDKIALNAELKKYINDFTEENPATGVQEHVAGFKNTTDNEAFVQNYSEGQYTEGLVFDTDNFDKNVMDFAKTASINDIYGPYETGDVIALSKLVAKKNVSDSINISHILISYKGAAVNLPTITLTKEQAKTKADSLLAVVNANPENFGEVALKNSDFDQSRLQKGNLGWFRHNDVLGQSPEFKKYVLNNGTGSIGLVEAPEGFHIIKIEEKKAPQTGYQFANIIREVEPSKETVDSVFNLSRKVAETFNGQDVATVDKKAGDFKLDLTTQNNLAQFKAEPTDFISLANSENKEAIEQITRWAFNENTNTKTAEVFDLTNGNYVVAYLVNKNPKGLMSASQTRSEVEPLLKNQVIAKKIIAKIGGANDLNAVAATTGQEIKTANNVNFANPVISGVGREDIVAGIAFGQKEGIVSSPIEGKNGVFVVKTLAVNKAPENEQNKANLKNRLKQLSTSQTIFSVTEALKAKSSIEDLRVDNPSFAN
ncbi:MAG: peptidylprolyl isomerase [Flavobacteriales bacterium]